MSKPDDIPQDVRENAERIARWIIAASNGHTDDLQTISEPIARAIMAATLAEMERILREFGDYLPLVVRNAIRKRGKP